jgi:hypothetical protein
MNTRVSGQEILPGFILDVDMIEEAISQICCDNLLLMILF